MTPRSNKKPLERTSRKGTMDRQNSTAGRENQQRRRTVHQQTSYHTVERLHSQQSYHSRASHHALRLYNKFNTMLDYSNTRYIKPHPSWTLIHSRYAISTDRFDLTGCSVVENSQRIVFVLHVWIRYSILFTRQQFLVVPVASCSISLSEALKSRNFTKDPRQYIIL